MFTDEQLQRYSRQLVLPNIGISGQEKLFNSKVLVVGAGGLGSSVLLYLAACGIGTLGIIDFDKVDLSNLHRQIIHTTNDLEKFKVVSAKEKINSLNPDVKVIIFNEKINTNNIEKTFSNFDVIVDGVDNFSDKFLINNSCVSRKKKFVHAGVVGYEGQILTIFPGESACLRCYFPDKEPQDFRQSCKDIGVLGTCVGVMSTLQATETMKIILQIGNPLLNRVLKYNALDSSFYEFKIGGINKNCPVCQLQT